VTGFSPSTSVSPVSIIPPMLHTHSYIYHRRCTMFFSQYFSFPCQYHSTNAPYSFIHLPPTLYSVSLPVLQFPLSVSFHQCSILIFIYMLLLPEGQTGESRKPFGNLRALNRKTLSLECASPVLTCAHCTINCFVFLLAMQWTSCVKEVKVTIDYINTAEIKYI
jgi:hypothetical protein